jgi:tetratricopeptide (TPR) repeat protein
MVAVSNARNLSSAIKHVVAAALSFCVVSSLLLSAPANAATDDEFIDSRVRVTPVYRHLVPPAAWDESNSPKSEREEQLQAVRREMIVPVSRNASRAARLAQRKHFAEAIGEWTRAIDEYSGDETPSYNTVMEPEWFLNRARLFIEVGLPDDARADIESALSMGVPSDKVRFWVGLLLVKLGNYERAENVLSSADAAVGQYRPYFKYFVADLQQKQGKVQLAKKTYLEAANLFESSSQKEAAQSCLDGIAQLDSRGNGTNSLKHPDTTVLNSPSEKEIPSSPPVRVAPEAFVGFDFNRFDLTSLVESDNFQHTESVLAIWLAREPNGPRAHMYYADYLFTRGDVSGALREIEIAIKYSGNDKSINVERLGNGYLIRKGTYLLEQKKFEEAMAIFSGAFPAVLRPEHLLLRARAEIGLNKVIEATKDLTQASKEFYEQGRIIKRDEAESLLSKIRTNDKKLPQVADSKVSEREKAAAIVRQLRQEKHLRDDATLKSRTSSIARAASAVIIAMPDKSSEPIKYMQAQLEFASIASGFRQFDITRSFVDKAIACYLAFFKPSYNDYFTNRFLTNLRFFENGDLAQRVDELAVYTEKFCVDEALREQRDRAFLEFVANSPMKFFIYGRLFQLREGTKAKAGFSANVFKEYVSADYKITDRIEIPSTSSPSAALSAFPFRMGDSKSTAPKMQKQFAMVIDSVSKIEKIFASIGSDNDALTGTLIGELESQVPSETLSKNILYSQYIAIARAYLNQGAIPKADTYLRKAVSLCPELENLKIGDVRCLLVALRTNYAQLKQFEPALLLYENAVATLTSTQNIDQSEILNLKMSLAALMLDVSRQANAGEKATSMRQKAQRLFDECAAMPLMKQVAGTSPEDLSLYRLIALEYPVLTKLDLAKGAVVCKEPTPGSVVGGVFDGRSVDVSGPRDIEITGNNDGRLTINLDGQSLTTMGLVQMDAGNLVLAESRLVAQLRAYPQSDAFGYLGELWFHQRQYDDALQAAALALVMDKRNAHAAAIVCLCREQLNLPSTSTAAHRALQNAATIAGTPEKPMIKAMSALALGDIDNARKQFSKVLGKYPKSFRAKQFKDLCRKAVKQR